MGRAEPPRRLIVNADDFGRTPEINEAVAIAHRDGILTTASLMVNEPAVQEAVTAARTLPGLGVGLHLALVCGGAAQSHAEAPGLVDTAGQLDPNPVRAGLRYFFIRGLRQELRAEIAAQFLRFEATGLPLDHINGHLNVHLHPVVFGLLLGSGQTTRPTGFRLTRDRFRLNARLARGNWPYRLSHAVIFGLLCARAAPELRKTAWRHTDSVFGLLQNARVDEAFVLGLLERLPPGDSELYSHPSLTDARHEFEALISPRVRAALKLHSIRLIRHQDL
ncbi:MAG: hopanoid biosynthesis-associated protein HpnK [Verrucomicrobiales bacterium]|nr:hopanoid biosynthesis-associated protein HpnK [Verrucomicrobiales bacterium]